MARTLPKPPRLPLLLLVLSALIHCYAAAADNHKPEIDPFDSGRVAFAQFTDRNGLPQNAIQAMAFDQKGYLWIGTQDGAAYYNGRVWTVVNMPNRMISNFVRSILIASDQSIWFGRQEGGVSRLKDGNWTTYDEKSGLPDKRVNALLETRAPDGSSIIWMGTDRGLAQFRNNQLVRADNDGPLQDDRVASLIEAKEPDGSSVVWVGSRSGLTRFSNSGRKTFTVNDGLPQDRITSLLATIDENGHRVLWAGTADGLVRYLPDENRFVLFDEKTGLTGNTVVCLTETIEGNGKRVLWAGTDAGGLFRYQDGTWTALGTREGLPSNSVFSLLASPGSTGTETLWIGTDGGGLARFNLGGWRSFSTSNGLPVNSIFSIFETHDAAGSAMWFGTYGGGLARLQNGSWTIFDKSSGMTDNTVFEMLETTLDDGQQVLWAGLKGGGLSRFQNGRWVKGDVERALGNATVRSMLATTDDSGARVVWAASGNHGLGRMSKNKWTFFNSHNGLPHDSVFEMAEVVEQDGTRALWVATGGGGLAHYAKGQWRVLNVNSGLPSNSVLSLLIDHTRNGETYLWAGTEGGGVARLELNGSELDAPHWLTFSDLTTPALPNNTIYQIKQDARGAIYLSHNKGVSRLTPIYDGPNGSVGRYNVNTFTTDDGLPANEGNGGVSLVDSKGRLWFGGVGGAAVFDPAEEVPPQSAAKLYIEKTLVGDKETSFATSQTLPHDQNRLSFEYSLLSFVHEERTRYRTQLVGLEKEPGAWTTDSKKDFASLPPGTYIFKVWGQDYRGNITGPALVSFTINPPLTRTWAAYGFYALALAGLALAVVRLRTRTLLKRNEWLKGRVNERTRELAEKVEQLRVSEQRAYNYAQAKSQFLANMSHEIRTPINGVIGMTSLLLDTPLTPDQRERAELVKRSGDMLLTIINDILDFSKIEAGKLTLESIDFELNSAIEDVLELVARKAQSKDLELASLIESDVPQTVQGDPIRLRQILINLVDNAIKFTDCGGISVCVHLTEATQETVTLKFEVRDTGIGIKAQELDNLFTAFTQADSSTTRRYGGTGLGLTIAKQLVELMSGEIGAESHSKPGEHGSTFWFTARFQRSAAAPAELPDFDKKKMLYVGPEGTQRTSILAQLERWKINATAIANGTNALKMLQNDPTDVVLIDSHVGDMEVRALARSILAETSARVILMTPITGYSELDEQCYLLAKPVRRAHLFAKLHSALNQVEFESPPSPDNVAVAEPPVPAKPYRLLLVEDNWTNQQVVVSTLAQLGYKVEIAKNGLEAVSQVQQTKYDLVFMDCHMPEMDGFGATTIIRSIEPPGCHTPIIAMTASALPEDRARCLSVGMDDYLTKPLSRSELCSILERWLPQDVEVQASERAPINQDALQNLRRIGGSNEGFLSELIEVFQNESIERLSHMKETASSGDLTTLRRLAHTHRGACINFGAQRMAQLCEQLEGTKTAEADVMIEMIHEIEREFVKVSRVLEVERVPNFSGRVI